MNNPLIFFECTDCDRGFKAPQNSRRRYCPECLARLQQDKGRRNELRSAKAKREGRTP